MTLNNTRLVTMKSEMMCPKKQMLWVRRGTTVVPLVFMPPCTSQDPFHINVIYAVIYSHSVHLTLFQTQYQEILMFLSCDLFGTVHICS